MRRPCSHNATMAFDDLPPPQPASAACSLTAWWSWLGWRGLYPSERAFVQQWFGAQQAAWLVEHVRIGRRRWGDTRRALSLNGGWLSFPRVCFEASDARQPLRLQHPAVAGIVAHELLHALQRCKGLPVTRQAAWLQCKAWLKRQDPYAYQASNQSVRCLRTFWAANVEQQGQMLQDLVQAHTVGQPIAHGSAMLAAVRAGRLRPQTVLTRQEHRRTHQA